MPSKNATIDLHFWWGFWIHVQWERMWTAPMDSLIPRKFLYCPAISYVFLHWIFGSEAPGILFMRGFDCCIQFLVFLSWNWNHCALEMLLRSLCLYPLSVIEALPPPFYFSKLLNQGTNITRVLSSSMMPLCHSNRPLQHSLANTFTIASWHNLRIFLPTNLQEPATSNTNCLRSWKQSWIP